MFALCAVCYWLELELNLSPPRVMLDQVSLVDLTESISQLVSLTKTYPSFRAGQHNCTQLRPGVTNNTVGTETKVLMFE